MENLTNEQNIMTQIIEHEQEICHTEIKDYHTFCEYIKKHYKFIKPTAELFSFYLEQWLIILRENNWLNRHIDL